MANILRNNIGSIAIFVFKRTLELMGRPEPSKVDALIEINRTIAAGLMSRASAAVSAPAAPAALQTPPNGTPHLASPTNLPPGSTMEPTDTSYGSRDFICKDPEGHYWWFGSYDPWAGPARA